MSVCGPMVNGTTSGGGAKDIAGAAAGLADMISVTKGRPSMLPLPMISWAAGSACSARCSG